MRHKHRKRIIQFIGIVSLVGLAIFLFVYLQQKNLTGLRINEVAFSLDSETDWIEIYNPTMNNTSLKGLYLSDNANEFSKFKIKQDLVVPAKGFAIIYCKGYESETEDSVVTNFRISNGETIYLVAKDGSTEIDSLSVLNDSENKEITIGRYPDGSDDIFLMSEVTQGDKNKKGLEVED